MPQDNIEKARSVIGAHMTSDSPLAQTLTAVLDELAVVRAGVNALTDRVEAVEDQPYPFGREWVIDAFADREEARELERDTQTALDAGTATDLPDWVSGARVERKSEPQWMSGPMWLVIGTENRGH